MLADTIDEPNIIPKKCVPQCKYGVPDNRVGTHSGVRPAPWSDIFGVSRSFQHSTFMPCLHIRPVSGYYGDNLVQIVIFGDDRAHVILSLNFLRVLLTQ